MLQAISSAGSTRSWSAWAMRRWPPRTSTTIANCPPRMSPAGLEREHQSIGPTFGSDALALLSILVRPQPDLRQHAAGGETPEPDRTPPFEPEVGPNERPRVVSRPHWKSE